MTVPRLLVVADRYYAGDKGRWLGILRDVADRSHGRPIAIQVRAKQAAPDEFVGLATAAREAVGRNVPLFLNGPEPLAERLGYNGVHWPEAAIPDHEGRVYSTTLRRSAAVHSTEALRRAERARVDFAVFGPVYEPGSKTGTPAGIEALRSIVAAAAIPVLAIGGITAARVPECIAAGAAGVAVVSGILDATSPAEALSGYLEHWSAAGATTGERT